MGKCRALWICLSFLAVGLIPLNAHATATQAFWITNNSGSARSDLHLEFAGTGGTATLEVILNASGCGVPVVSNPGTPWDITWPSACVAPGAKIKVRITSPSGGVTFVSGRWTPGDISLSSGDVQQTQDGPGLSPWGLLILTVFLLGAGAFAVTRRRTQVA